MCIHTYQYIYIHVYICTYTYISIYIYAPTYYGLIPATSSSLQVTSPAGLQERAEAGDPKAMVLLSSGMLATFGRALDLGKTYAINHPFYSSYGDLDDGLFFVLSTLALPSFFGGLFQLGFVEGDVLVIRVFVCFFSASWGLVNR